jgi:uroporphyrin-III C-methyltransferase
MTGTVYLVGAGPGDPRLITLRGAEVLRVADVVVYDRLAPSELLHLAPRHAELIDAGKAKGRCPLGQDEINKLLVENAREEKTVVRLKGGDPFVFGRGGEEAMALSLAAVPFEIVPGVTSAVAAPAYAGIPLTHRGIGASFAVVTATLKDGRDNDLRRIAAAVDTLVVLMAAGKIEAVCTELIDAGRSPDQPAAVVSRATTGQQRSVVTTIAELPGLAASTGIEAPATLIAGEVVSLAGVLAWFEESTERQAIEATR